MDFGLGLGLGLVNWDLVGFGPIGGLGTGLDNFVALGAGGRCDKCHTFFGRERLK